jgi:hypothetical protein
LNDPTGEGRYGSLSIPTILPRAESDFNSFGTSLKGVPAHGKTSERKSGEAAPIFNRGFLKGLKRL